MFPFKRFSEVIVFDVETTGLNAHRDSIIEFGAVKAAPNGSVRETDLLIRLREGQKLPAEITRLTGITAEALLRDGTDAETAAQRISSLISGPSTLLAAYNAQFDLCFLYFFLQRFGLEKCLKDVKMLDLLTVYKDRRPYPHKLSDAVSSYCLSARSTHRAADDAAAAWELLRAMHGERSDLDLYINLFGYNPRYGVSGPRISSVTYRAQRFNPVRKLYEE